MRRIDCYRGLVLLNLTSAILLAAPGLIAPAPLTVGRDLEMYIGFRLTQPAPEGGLPVTISSDDPTRLLLAANPTDPGAKSITVRINAGYIETPDFFVQAVGEKGTATYTASAPGFASAQGIVNLAQSAILIRGPSKSLGFKAVIGMAEKVTLFAVAVDAPNHDVVEQPVAGGLSARAEIKNSDPRVGYTEASSLEIGGGQVSVSTLFKSAGVGDSTLTVAVSPHFAAQLESNSVNIHVELPGIGLISDVFLGKDLELSGSILLGAPAPTGGLDVTVSSANPNALLLSNKADVIGSGTITVHVPEGEMRAPYHLQALGSSGEVETTASAPGYRTRIAPVFLAPSGFMVVYGPYGPPDEAEYLRTILVRDKRPFTVSLSHPEALQVRLWPVYLDAKTKRGADITAQRLRPGVSVKLSLANSNPDVAQVASSVTISGPDPSAGSEFVPLSPGQTTISVAAPPGFTEPSNATSVTATVTR